MKQYKIAVVGATGMVGRKFLQVLEERKLPVSEYYLFASARTAGTKLPFMGKEYEIRELTETAFDGLGVDIALWRQKMHEKDYATVIPLEIIDGSARERWG